MGEEVSMPKVIEVHYGVYRPSKKVYAWALGLGSCPNFMKLSIKLRMIK
ncbi:hypothetical protein [Vulcanisaeta distributa]|nr:hypothetical protein [Vulcanisaeta distributa]